jgi:hypothetical protein
MLKSLYAKVTITRLIKELSIRVQEAIFILIFSPFVPMTHGNDLIFMGKNNKAI